MSVKVEEIFPEPIPATYKVTLELDLKGVKQLRALAGRLAGGEGTSQGWAYELYRALHAKDLPGVDPWVIHDDYGTNIKGVSNKVYCLKFREE